MNILLISFLFILASILWALFWGLIFGSSSPKTTTKMLVLILLGGPFIWTLFLIFALKDWVES